MAEKILSTRIMLRYDSYENWTTNNPVLKVGEVAIATVASNSGDIKNAPNVLIKVGDGTSTYSALKFVSALAADVLAACKTEAGLTEYITNVINNSGIATSDALTTLAGRVTTAESDIDTLELKVGSETVAKQISDAIAALNLGTTYETKTDAAQKLVDAKAYADGKDEAIAAAKKAGDDAQANVDALAGKVGEVAEGTTIVKMIEDAKSEATYDDTQVKADIKANSDAIDAIEADYLKGADKSELSGLITAEKERAEGIEGGLRTDVNAIKADYLKAADKQALQIQIDTIINNPDTEGVINSINEFTQYIADHGEIAEGFRTDIDANAKAIEDLGAVNVSTYETKTDASAKLTEAKTYADGLNTAMNTRVEALEAIDHDHSNKTVLDGITAEKVTAWDAAEQNARDYADGLADNYDAAGTAEGVKTELTTEINKKANDTDLAAVAKSGLIDDLSIGEGTVLIFDCGDSVGNSLSPVEVSSF